MKRNLNTRYDSQAYITHDGVTLLVVFAVYSGQTSDRCIQMSEHVFVCLSNITLPIRVYRYATASKGFKVTTVKSGTNKP